jgi:hypothetical protein
VDGAANPVIDLEDVVPASPPQTASAEVATGVEDVGQPQTRSAADRFARKVLRLQDPAGTQEVHNIFSSSIALSATRCLLSYIILPGLALVWGGLGLGTLHLIGPIIGIPVGVLALVFDVRAIRRFFQADHRWRWAAAALYMTVMVMVAALVIRDIVRLA